ncbi:MAG: hypothetical protein K1X78_14260 [Verrucomicrobiaceae bacterium]|nr:hypothetical protein [Verrucomicrobiaceae bacterium]
MSEDDDPYRRLRVAAIFLTSVGVLVALLCFYVIGKVGEVPKAFVEVTERAMTEAAQRVQPLIGPTILKQYADPASTPEDDLTLMSRALGNFSLLVKGDDPLPLGANEDIAEVLRGKNKAHLRFLPDDSPVFDKLGRIIDRWGTPLYFHAESRDHLDIRSAGPDKQMWTADDLHRRYDGSLLHGDALLAPSLFQARARGGAG